MYTSRKFIRLTIAFRVEYKNILFEKQNNILYNTPTAHNII